MNNIIELYKRGMSTRQIGQKLGKSSYDVWHYLKNNNIKIRSLSEAMKLVYQQGRGHRGIHYLLLDKLPEIKQLYEQGQSVNEIASAYDINTVTLYCFLRQTGFQFRNHSQAAKIAVNRGTFDPGSYMRGKRGSDNPYWKGGKHKTADGYIMVYNPDYPRAYANGYILEHILVWEKTHNRPVPPNWHIHHINGITTDNRPSNLIALSSKKHSQIIPLLKQKIRELEIENNQLHRALENNQMIFTISEN